MDADIEQRAAAGEVGIGKPGAGTGNAASADVVRFDVGQLAEAPACVLFVEHRHRTGVSVVEADHADSIALFSSGCDALGALEGMCKRLFDQDVTACLECSNRDWFVESVWRRHDDGIDGVVDDEVLVGFVRRSVELTAKAVALFRNQIRAGNDISAEVFDTSGVEMPHAAESNDTDTDSGANHRETPRFWVRKTHCRGEHCRFDPKYGRSQFIQTRRQPPK